VPWNEWIEMPNWERDAIIDELIEMQEGAKNG
jgi:hypothetical protein